MRLNDNELKNSEKWEKAGIRVPTFDRAAMLEATKEAPEWVHFGCGNLFRAFPAALQQTLLDKRLVKTGIIAVEGYDYEIIDRFYRPHDNLSLLVTLKADGRIEKTVIGSIADSYCLDTSSPDFSRLKQIFASKALKMATFTITEKGYNLTRRGGETLPDVKNDFAAGPMAPASYIGKVAALLHTRYQSGAPALAMVSLDNCSHNGDRLRAAICAFAEKWTENGLAEKGFADYVHNSSLLSFTWSMIDKITPRPDDGVKAMLQKSGFDDTECEITAKHSYAAPFVNSEEAQYLVIEDDFPAGRPPLEEAGVIFTDRATVEKAEKMKVCTCLNPLHTALAIFGCLLGFKKISDEMKDPDLSAFVRKLGYSECLPAAADPGILSPERFLKEVLETRLPNPFMPDTPQRIATDTSQKLSIRFGQTINAYRADAGLELSRLKLIPLVLAGWCRYLIGLDDNGQPFEISPDPLGESLKKRFSGLKLGENRDNSALLRPLLSDASIFGVDLYEVGLGEKVETDFALLTAGPGAIRAAIRKALD